MKRFFKSRFFKPALSLLGLGLIVALAVIQAPTAESQVVYIANPYSDPGNRVVTEDGDILFIIKYIGPLQSGTVTVATTNLTFKSGVQGSEAADTTLECPISGPLGGIFDFTNAACDTVGEVVDLINASTSWRAVPIDALRSDFTYSSSVKVKAVSETQARTVDGVALPAITDNRLNLTAALLPHGYRTSIAPYLEGNQIRPLPLKGIRPYLSYFSGVATLTGADTFEVFEVTNFNPKKGAGETENLVFTAAGATTGVEGKFDFTNAPIFGQYGSKLLVRYKAATTFSSGQRVTASGYLAANVTK